MEEKQPDWAEMNVSRSGSTALMGARINKVIELLPVIITMCVLGIIGIIGNVVTIRFYCLQRRTPTVFLITSLAAVDLIVCVLFAPNVAEMIVNVQYTSRAACKSMHFLGHCFVESSGLILGFIALDRYWTICTRFRKKVTEVIAKRVVITMIVFSCLMSVRDFVNFDVTAVNIHTSQNKSAVIGHYCSHSYDPNLKWSVLIFHGIDAVTFLSILVTIVFTYSSVIWTLCKVKDMGNAKLKSIKPLARSINNLKSKSTLDITKTHDKTPATVDAVVSEKPRVDTIEDDMDTGASMAENYSTLTKKKRTNGPRKIRKSELNVTMLMLAVSAAFFLCAAPYFAIRIGLRSVKRDSDLELGLLVQFGLRLCYINSVLNPLIYCLFNPSFRRHMKRVLVCNMDPVEEPYSITSKSTDLSNA